MLFEAPSVLPFSLTKYMRLGVGVRRIKRVPTETSILLIDSTNFSQPLGYLIVECIYHAMQSCQETCGTLLSNQVSFARVYSATNFSSIIITGIQRTNRNLRAMKYLLYCYIIQMGERRGGVNCRLMGYGSE